MRPSLSLAIGLFCALGGAALAANTDARQQASPVPPPPKTIAYCDLARDPKPFDNTRIRITAFVNYAFEDFSMWQPECMRRDSSFSLWVTFGGSLNSGVIYCCPGEGIPRSAATPYPLVEDDTLKTLRALLVRERDTVVRLTVVGTLLLRPEPKNDLERMIGHYGYGHMACCSLLVIEQVEQFDSHERKDVDYSASSGHYEGRDLRCRATSYEGHLNDASGNAFLGPSFDGGDAFMRAQRLAESGERKWAFTEPARVALEAVRHVRGAGVKSLKRRKEAPGLQVFDYDREGKRTTVVVARPSWLTFYSASAQVAWVVTKLESQWCAKLE